MARNERFSVSQNIDFFKMAGLGTAEESSQQKTLINEPSLKTETVKEELLEERPVKAEIIKEETVESIPSSSLNEQNCAELDESAGETYEPVDKSSPALVEHVNASAQEVQVVETATVALYKKIKENRSVHKNFLLTPTLAQDIAIFSKQYGVSQNDLVNDILSQVFAAARSVNKDK